MRINICTSLLLLTFLLQRCQTDSHIEDEGSETKDFFEENIQDVYTEEIEDLMHQLNENEVYEKNNGDTAYQMSDEDILANLQIIEEEIDNKMNDNSPDSSSNNQQTYSTTDSTNIKRSKILLIPSAINSHVIFFGQVGQRLAKLGHDVEILVASCIPDYFRAGDIHKNFVATRYKVNRDVSVMSSESLSSALLSVALSDSTWFQYYTMFNLEYEANSASEDDCRQILYNKDLMRYLDGERFDFVITDPIAVHCYNIIPLKLNAPFGILSLPFIGTVFGVPRLPSVTPFIGMKATDRMTFYQRISSFLQELLFISVFDIKCDDCKNILPANVAHPSGTKEMLALASAWFFQEDLSITYPAANQPNTMSVGAIISSAIQSKPLPQELEEFVSTSNIGTILVSFGSFFDNVPEYLGNVFCRVFKARPRNKIIWKMKYTPTECKRLANLKIASWIPQVDLLAHPKTALFVTHGGFNSIGEALHHQVLMIVIPIAIDQKTNAAAVEDKGYAIAMELGSKSLEAELTANIDTILRDESYRTSIRKYSTLLRSGGESAEVGMSRLIDHIVEYGGDHLKSSAVGMPLLRLYMFDVYSVLAGVAIAALLAMYIIFARFCSRVKSLASRKIKRS